MLNSTEHEISSAHKKLKYRQIKKFLALSLSDFLFTMLINVKMPTIVGILTFISRINFILSWVEYEKSFIASGLDSTLVSVVSNGANICRLKHKYLVLWAVWSGFILLSKPTNDKSSPTELRSNSPALVSPRSKLTNSCQVGNQMLF